MAHLVAVDLGGTNLRAALFTNDAPPPVKISKHPTPASDGVEAVIKSMITAIEDVLIDDQPPDYIGIGAPGPLDPSRGVIIEAPNLPGWENIPLAEKIRSHFKVPVILGNDANLAALGEWRHGAGHGAAHLIYLTISTGIGGGIIVNNELLLGEQGVGAELGHVTVDPQGPVCSCGQRGHIEAMASGTALAEQAIEALEAGRKSSLETPWKAGTLTARDVGQAAQAGDQVACDLIQRAGQLIGHYVADLTHIFNPEIVVIGGGVSQLGDLLFNPIRAGVQQFALSPIYYQQLEIVPAALGDDAGLIGAMVLASMQ
ncbi:MAG: ROK family protein [Anaerolineales bacterium]|jgi:glucokinase